MHLSRCGVEIASVIGAAKHFAADLASTNSDRLNEPNTLQQFAVADSGLLEGLPGSMFDWRESRTFL